MAKMRKILPICDSLRLSMHRVDSAGFFFFFSEAFCGRMLPLFFFSFPFLHFMIISTSVLAMKKNIL